MTTSLPDQASCPGCFKRVAVADATTCAACGAAVWADGRLLLVAPVEEGRASMFRGLLRGDGDGSASGLEEVVVKVLDVGEGLSLLPDPSVTRARAARVLARKDRRISSLLAKGKVGKVEKMSWVAMPDSCARH